MLVSQKPKKQRLREKDSKGNAVNALCHDTHSIFLTLSFFRRSFNYSLLPTIVSILTTIPPSTPNPLEPPHSHAIHVLLNFPISTSALLVTRSQQASLLTVLMQILDDTLKYSLNTDEEASTDGMSNGTELDEIVPPLVIVLTNIASTGGGAKAALKARLLPNDV